MAPGFFVTAAAVIVMSAVVFDRTESRFVVEKGSVSVVSPYDIQSKHDAAIANFGVPDYGGSMYGSLASPPESQATGCSPFEGEKPFKSNSSRPTILLLNRGGCYFALKVWNGQQAGAAAVLVADTVDERLITMDSPEEGSDAEGYIEKIGIPSAMITKSFGDKLKEALNRGKSAAAAAEDVVLKIDWSESMPHPDERVEYELWTNSNDECGVRCDEQINFIKDFKGHAQILEKAGYTQFTPHYITWYCPPAFVESNQCKSQCINRGRYCAPDPDHDFTEGYQGKDIVHENLRQLCVHRVSNESNRSWVWWDYVTDFHIRCSMKQKRFSKECAEEVMKSLGLPIEKINKCVGDPEADTENEILKAEQEVQVGHGSRGDVTILPTMVINNVQYRGKLERAAILRAVCAGFKEESDPPICLSGGIETNECLENNGGCWKDLVSNVTACKDTFRGRICECPLVKGVQYQGDGYSKCQGIGAGRCLINNGGCWSDTKSGTSYSACLESDPSGCRCPSGFRGDGHKCEDVDECKDNLVCSCDGCSCKNTWGGFQCTCKGEGQIYIKEHNTCIDRNNPATGRVVVLVVIAVLTVFALSAYVFYKYRLRSYMDSEIMAIMSQYMPIDSQQSQHRVVHHEDEPVRSV